MKVFFCELINKNGIVLKRFYRQGQTETEILKGLKMFSWPRGSWSIGEVELNDYD